MASEDVIRGFGVLVIGRKKGNSRTEFFCGLRGVWVAKDSRQGWYFIGRGVWVSTLLGCVDFLSWEKPTSLTHRMGTSPTAPYY